MDVLLWLEGTIYQLDEDNEARAQAAGTGVDVDPRPQQTLGEQQHPHTAVCLNLPTCCGALLWGGAGGGEVCAVCPDTRCGYLLCARVFCPSVPCAAGEGSIVRTVLGRQGLLDAEIEAQLQQARVCMCGGSVSGVVGLHQERSAVLRLKEPDVRLTGVSGTCWSFAGEKHVHTNRHLQLVDVHVTSCAAGGRVLAGRAAVVRCNAPTCSTLLCSGERGSGC